MITDTFSRTVGRLACKPQVALRRRKPPESPGDGRCGAIDGPMEKLNKINEMGGEGSFHEKLREENSFQLNVKSGKTT